MYWIFRQESTYQSGILCSFMIGSHSSFKPFPLRTLSMIVKARPLSIPIWIRYTIISSRQQIAPDSSTIPSLIRSCAFPSHTPVPCDRPEIRTRSEKLFGLASITICIAKSVPNSGTPRQPSFVPPISSGVIPKASVLWNREMTSLSSRGTFLASVPVRSSRWRIILGSSCPNISSFNRLWSIEWYSKCVVVISVVISLAGRWIGVNISISMPCGTTMIPPGCCPVVRFTPVQPFASLVISQRRSVT